MSIILHPPRTRESLTESLEILGRAHRLARLVRASAQLFLVFMLPLLTLGLADALWHLPAGLRALGLVMTLLATTWTFRRQWWTAWQTRTDPLAVALTLEERYPQLQDTLASAVTFLQRLNPDRLESPQQFSTAVIRAARRWYERTDLQSWIPTGAAWRATWYALIVLAVASVVTLVDSQRAVVALLRFIEPYGAHPWPPRTRIEIIEPQVLPTRLARGESWTLVFVVQGLLPEQAEIEIRLATGEQWRESYPLTTDPVRGNAAPVSVHWPGQRFSQSYQFRIRANDHITPWQSVTVVPPPQFLSLQGRPSPQFRVTPPSYTGLNEMDLPDGAAVLEIPVGSLLRVHARCDTALSEARLVYLGEVPHHALLTPLRGLQVGSPSLLPPVLTLHHALLEDIPLQLHDHGTVIHGCFQPALAGLYAWKLTDNTGLTSTRLLEIRLIPDPSPQVTVLRPHIEQDPQWYVPTAQLPLHVLAADPRYGLRRVSLEYSWEGEGVLHTWELLDLSQLRRTAPALLGSLPFARPLRHYRCEQFLPLQQLRHADGRPPQPGDVLHLRMTAWDWDEVTPYKTPGRNKNATSSANSPPILSPGEPSVWDFTITIVTADTLLALVQRELVALLPESVRLREQHQDAQEQMQGYISRPDGPHEVSNRERLLRVELRQRQLRGRLEDPHEGLLGRVLRLQNMVQTNALPPSSTTRRLQTITALLQRLAEHELPTLDNRLRELQEVATGKLQQADLHEERLSAMRQQQRIVHEQLQTLVDLLSEWSGAADVRSAARLLQQQVRQQASELQRLSEQIPPGLAPVQLAAERQAELQRQAARLETAVEQAESLLSRAARLAQTKETEAEQARSAAAIIRHSAGEKLQQAQRLPQDSHQRAILQAQAAVEQTQAQERQHQAESSAREAAALRQALQAAQGQATAEDLRQAAGFLRNNQQMQAVQRTLQAAERLERLITALTEQATDPIPELARLRSAADTLDALGTAQEELYRRSQEAAQHRDPAQRSTELQRLARHQAQLQEQARQLLQRLQRQGPPEALNALHDAIDRMTTAQQALNQGQPAWNDLAQSIQRLDEARDLLDAAVETNTPVERLVDEKRRQLRDRLQALLERQRSRIHEAQRLHQQLLSQRRWTRALQQSYAALAEDQKQLAEDVRPLGEELRGLPVFEHFIREAAGLLSRAAERIQKRLEDLDPDLPWDDLAEASAQQRLVQPMEQAARCLELLVQALQDESHTQPMAKAAKHPPVRPASFPSDSGSTTAGEIISPLAQLKALRAWQAEIHQRTAAFARNHPDLTRLSDTDREELQELEAAQRTIGTLIQKFAPLLGELNTLPSETPALPETAPPPRPVQAKPSVPKQPDAPEEIMEMPSADDALPTHCLAKRPSVLGICYPTTGVGCWNVAGIYPLLMGSIAVASVPESNDHKVAEAPPPRPVDSGGPAELSSPPGQPENPLEILQRIIRNAQKASQELAQANPGPQTQQTQRHILKDLDALLQPPPPSSNSEQPKMDSSMNTPKDSPPDKQVHNQPPSSPMAKNELPNPPSSTSQPKGGMPPQGNTSGSSSPSGSKSSESESKPPSTSSPGKPETSTAFRRRPRHASQAQKLDWKGQSSPSPQDQIANKGAFQATQTTEEEPKAPGSSLVDARKKSFPSPRSDLQNREQDWVRNVWGHLPDALRRQASEYYRQELIPKYSKLLEQYYSSRLQKK
jgi:hypothetical protein